MLDAQYVLYAYSPPMRADLRKARVAVGLTQAELAHKIGRDQGTVSRYEGGKAPVDLDVAPVLAEVLGLEILTVLYGYDPGASAACTGAAVGLSSRR